MRNQDDGRAHPGRVGQQVAKDISNGGRGSSSSSSARSRSPYLAPRRQCRPTSNNPLGTGDYLGVVEAATTLDVPLTEPAAYGSGMVQSLIARYGGGRSRSRSRGREECAAAAPAAQAAAAAAAGDRDSSASRECGASMSSNGRPVVAASAGHRWSGLPRQTTVQNGFGSGGGSSHDTREDDDDASPKSPSKKSAELRLSVSAAASAPTVHGGHHGFVRPMIILQSSCDSFCSPTPSPAAEGGHSAVPPSWLLQQLPLPERSRRSSCGSADSAVCDLSSAAESCDGGSSGGVAAACRSAAGGCGGDCKFEVATAAEAQPAAAAAAAAVSADDADHGVGDDGAALLPRVVVQPGSPAGAPTHDGMDAEDAAGDDVSAGSGSYRMTRSQPQQQQLLLLAVSEGLQRKLSSESSICSEMSECSSFNCESMDDEQSGGGGGSGACFNIGDQVSWQNAEKPQQPSLPGEGSHPPEATAAWIQLAGHRGTFLPFRSGTILKKHCSMEETALRGLMSDPLHQFIPKLFGVVTKDGEKYIEIEDLLAGFRDPSVMDCKIGVRTYLEDELEKALRNPQPRQDMYEKMVKVDPSEPTAEEHQQKGVTKPRYMQWRERVSSSEMLGFRIEAVRHSDGTAVTDFKKTRDRESVMVELLKFTGGQHSTLMAYLQRLTNMRRVMEDSDFLAKHEVIGSSLLFVHDASRAEVWMIDFGKTLPLDKGTSVTHRAPWCLGNHEDGYLTGVDSIISVLADIVHQRSASAVAS